MKTITLEMASKLIEQTNGKVFAVEFTKKDGTLREMTCRLGVTKHLKGGELAYDAAAYDLLPVFDMKSNGYRMINLSTLQSIKVDGDKYKVV